MINKIKLFFLLLWISSTAFAQNPSESKSFGMVAKSKNGQIYLRWSATNQAIWDKGNKVGYTLTRINVQTKEKTIIAKNFKPQSKAFWQQKVNEKETAYATNAYAIHAYAESKTKPKDMFKAVEEAEQIFLIAMIGADLNFEVAQAAALGFIDKTVKTGESYTYTLMIDEPNSRIFMKPETSSTVMVKDGNALPQINIMADFGEKATVLTWNCEKLVGNYSNYTIERSIIDSLHFQKNNQAAVFNANEGRLFEKIYVDSLADYKHFYYYRVKGKDLFQDEGNYSNIVKGKPQRFIPQPEIKKHEIIDYQTIKLSWAFGDSLNNDILGFKIQSSDSLYTGYTDATPLFSSEQRSRLLTVEKLQTNLRVLAVIDAQRSTYSYPTAVIASDSIPPSIPTGVYARVDSSGIVTIVWDKNTEPDLQGYYVARTDPSTNLIARISKNVISKEFYQDSLSMKLMNREYLYSVMSVDKRYNVSDISEMVRVLKIDIYAPTSPLFLNYTAEPKAISLKWARSSSSDAISHSLLRRELPNKTWDTLTVFRDSFTKTYIDSSVVEQKMYAYALIATDESGNKSPLSTVLILESLALNENIEFNGFEAKINEKRDRIILQWSAKNIAKIEKYMLYRSVNKGDLLLVKAIENTQTYWNDPLLSSTAVHKYVLRAKTIDGFLSGWKEIEINPLEKK